MIKTNRRVRLCAALLAVNILFIWGNSLLPASVSATISHWVRNILAAFLPGGSGGEPNAGHGLVRKLAHFTEFACLGALLTWLLSMYRRAAIWALPLGAFVASIDETIQRFVPGRGPRVTDVLIDTTGVAVGIGLLLLGYTVRKIQKRKTEDTTK